MQVRASADDAKRGFLERKGLTAAEVAEAFSRVSSLPAPPPQPAPAPYSAGTQATWSPGHVNTPRLLPPSNDEGVNEQPCALFTKLATQNC